MVVNSTSVSGYYRKHGFSKLLRRCFERCGFVCYSRSLIFLQVELAATPDEVEDTLPLQAVSSDELRAERDYDDGWFGREQALERLGQGHRLYAVKKEGRMVYFAWIEQGMATVRWFGSRFALPKGVAYITGLYTLPAFRGMGIAFCAGRQMLLQLKRSGLDRAFVVIDPQNGASLRLHERLGFKPYQTVTYNRCWFLGRFCVREHGSERVKVLVRAVGLPNRVWDVFAQTARPGPPTGHAFGTTPGRRSSAWEFPPE